MSCVDQMDAIKRANPWACWSDCVEAACRIEPDGPMYDGEEEAAEHREALPESLYSVVQCARIRYKGAPVSCMCCENVVWFVRGVIHLAGGEVLE